jgi:hypothetical protein
MNLIHELRHGRELHYQAIGRPPTAVFVPVWRSHELQEAAHEMGPCVAMMLCKQCDSTPECDFEIIGLKGFWWNRDYIEYRL